VVVAKGLLNTKKSEEVVRGIHSLSREGSKIQGSGFVEREGVGTEFAVDTNALLVVDTNALLVKRV
jgi:hypothetical protein